MASMGQSDDVPFDLTILFFDDAFQWCEYLFDLFQAYDLTQNSERINDFPTNEVTLSNIKRSFVQLVIISPQCVESCSTMIEQVTMSNSTIGLICGTNEEDIELLYKRIPSAKSWKLVDTTAKSIVTETMTMIKQPQIYESNEELLSEAYYMEMNKDDQVDLYLPMIGDSSNDIYMDMENPNMVDDSIYEHMGTQQSKNVTVIPRVIPSTTRCGRSESVVLLFKDAIEGEDFTVEFCKGNKKTTVPAIKVNPCTLTIETPKDYPSGCAQATVYANSKKLATCRFTFQSSMDALADILDHCSNPIEFLCDTLNMSPGDCNQLDSYLSNLSKRIIDTDRFRDAFGVDDMSVPGKCNKEYPTILHFAAKYGLSDLCVVMMNMPCVSQALNLSNRNGKTPADLADESGFSDLNAVLKSYQDSDIYDPTFINQGPNAYVEMDPKKKAYGNTAKMASIHYVKPFKVPIPAYKIEKVLKGNPEDVAALYDTLPSPLKVPSPPMKTEPAIPSKAPLSIDKNNQEKDEHIVPPSSLDPFQRELIKLQESVKQNEITVDEAVKIFENLRTSLTNPLRIPMIDPQLLKKEIEKKKKPKDGKKDTASPAALAKIKGSPKIPHDMAPMFDVKSDGSRPSSIASSQSRTSTCSRDSSVLNFDEVDDDSMYTTMQIPLPAIPSEEGEDELAEGDYDSLYTTMYTAPLPGIPPEEMVYKRISKLPHREPPATPSRHAIGLPSDLPMRPPPPRPGRPTPQDRPTPAPRKNKPE
ncbi:B-cell scaffold protein with ankyrin repeats-like isoform X13 [Antedon mediterranea]|uniref:B-cell scaffold protein with ankyrin repeats-like isoform X13 n=1 Tax=Antedon mediterranea TaxID=105859 RepID=UPI003AF658FE